MSVSREPQHRRASSPDTTRFPASGGPAGGSAWIVALLGMLLLLGVVFVIGQSDGDALDATEIGLVEDEFDVSDDEEQAAVTTSSEPERAVDILPPRKSGPADPSRSTGLIHGQLAIDESLRDDLRVWTLEIEEAINGGGRPSHGARRYRRRFEVEAGVSISHFEFADIPFSEYGWRVAAMSFEPYAASAAVMLPLDRKRPEGTVQLALKPASTVQVTCKDQEHKALPEVRVTLTPKGFPPKRKVHTLRTGVYGLAMLEGVAKGEYELAIGPLARPLVPRRRITVRGEKTQFESVVVPKGGSLQLMITTTAGAGVHNAEVVAIAKDRRVYKKYETRSDRSGRATLEHLPPGEYYLHLTKQRFRRSFQKIKIVENAKLEKRTTLHWDFR